MAAEGHVKPEINDESPWLIFEIKNVLYALNCSKIQSIMKRPEAAEGVCTHLPDAPDYIRDMLRIRDNVVPTLDLRRLYGIASVDEEYHVFQEMIDRRKTDHENWMNTLKKCMATGEDFTLARDPRECAFGKWFYHHLENQAQDNQIIEFALRKLEEPHRELHEMADKMLPSFQGGDEDAWKASRQEIMRRAEEKLMPQILTLLDEVKNAFYHRYQEKLIVVEEGDKRIAVIVDDVKAIDQLEHVDGREQFGEMMQSRYIYSVGRGKKINDIVLMIKAEELLTLVQQGKCNE